jgi:site-specific recombinase XerD
MIEERISPLRRRMIEDMTVRHFTSKTQHDYITAVMKLARFLGGSPDTATNEDLRRFQLHLTENRAGAPIINSTVSALRFFFSVTLDRADATRHLTFVHEPRKLPIVLSPEEVARLLEAAPGVKYKAALSVAHSAGLRVSEVVSLKVSDIDSTRMMLRVERGKGGKDRYAMLSPQLLELLRDWWRIARPQVWLFPGLDPINPMSTRQLNRACHAAAHMGEIVEDVLPAHDPVPLKRVVGSLENQLPDLDEGRLALGTVREPFLHPLLPEAALAVDAANLLLEHGRVPLRLELHHHPTRLVQVEPLASDLALRDENPRRSPGPVEGGLEGPARLPARRAL